MADKKIEILEAPYLKTYEAFKNKAIYNPELSTNMPEILRDIPAAMDPLLKQFLVNTDYPIIASGDHLRWVVFQHIRKVGEILAGTYEVDDEEFNIVFPTFIKDFFFGEVWVGYSEELRLMEEVSLDNPDFFNRVDKQDALLESKWRLYRRYVEKDKQTGKEAVKWSSAITGLAGYEIDTEKTPLIKCTFNKGLMFWEMWEIHLSFETGKQMADWLFFSSGKKLKCRVKDVSTFVKEVAQLRSPGVVFAPSSRIGGKMNHWEVINPATMQEAREAYDYVLNKYNDDMGRFGFAGDNSSKAERETTGENFRALQPNSVFQKSMLQKLKTCSKRISDVLGMDINFGIGIESNEQGIPEFDDEMPGETDDGEKEITNDND